jgi:DNA-binding CsgD family transcriptional regulator
MNSTEELSTLLAALYAAPLEPQKWQVFFDHLSQLTNISCGYLIKGSESQGQEILAGGGFSFNPEVLRLYKEHYGPIDPFWSPFLLNPRVTVIRGEELVSHDHLLKTEFYNDLLARYEMESMTLLSCSPTVEQTDVMPVWRRSQDGPMEEASIALLQTILPHAHIALQTRSRLEASVSLGHFADMALDAITMAVFLVTSTGRIRHMNKLAATHLLRPNGLRLDSGRLAATDPGEDAQIEFLISQAAGTHSNSPKAAPGGAMKISRRDTQSALQITVIPTPDSFHAGEAAHCALVIVHDPSSLPKSRAAFMRQLYALTPTEARLADLLLEGLDVREAAERLSITLETCRFHTKRVLTKTGTRRQIELIRLMLSLPGQ